MTVQISLTFEELSQAVTDYAKAHGANVPDNSRVQFQCFGPDVVSVGGIKSISANIVIAEQAPAAPAATA